ncbi:hypothetical protein CDL15_Pgr028651 [Punica granatum]|uniref:2'-phosphotransferase n=1 Tax=Punica granatum TaxID=22663 RepID=A0A218VX84_PUNGR|nr:hypothetical protein CDL15_Pgr028651 [Punica granatum]
MWTSLTSNSFRILRYCYIFCPHFPAKPTTSLIRCRGLGLMDVPNNPSNHGKSSSFSAFAHSTRSGGRGRGGDLKSDRERSRGHGGASGKDRIDALGRLLTRILRHMATELNLNMRSDGRDNKQRFSLLEEAGELLIRANQGHTVKAVETENLLKPILSAEEVPVCVHGTYKKNLKLILETGLNRMQRLHVHFSRGLPTDGEVISGMRRDVNVLIFLGVRKALEDGMKLYVSDNQVILTEGFEGVVPVKYFEKILSWPDKQVIPF